MPHVPCVTSSHVQTQLMIPARNDCPSGWTKEYYGYLMSGAQWPQEILAISFALTGMQSLFTAATPTRWRPLYLVEGQLWLVTMPPVRCWPRADMRCVHQWNVRDNGAHSRDQKPATDCAVVDEKNHLFISNGQLE
ncbi:hypothetical protein OS493_040371 [Desmophyllum pertusum]|uniref:Uncharacterized protein n=1 Tax=Desmophyllum pertusum TaxID=174260 RepID=A0A9X0CU15_9CNID|nr:hypothetical protein OS493_040371 [Desmophyllum pertusum]